MEGGTKGTGGVPLQVLAGGEVCRDDASEEDATVAQHRAAEFRDDLLQEG